MSKSSYYLVITGDDSSAIRNVEERFKAHLNGRELVTIKPGKVKSLLKSYRDIVKDTKDPDSIFMFCHQDAYPAFLPDASNDFDVNTLQTEHKYLEAAITDPAHWLNVSEVLLSNENTGFLGVAGALGINPGSAWWNYPEISGAVLHNSEAKGLLLNVYGIFGQVLVLDGLFLMCKAETILEMGDFNIDEDRFHFYDMELCLRAHGMGKKNYTIPLMMAHGSSGATINNEKWQQDMDHFSENIQYYLKSGKTQEDS